MKITVTANLNWLGKCSNPDKLWEKIHSEYTELSGDTSSNAGLDLAKKITFLSNKINITNSIVYYLSLRRVEGLIIELQAMGYRLKFDNLEEDLKRVISLSKSDHVKLSAAQESYKKLQEVDKTTEKDWYRILSALARHRQVANINPALITVMEYIVMEQDFKQFIAANKK